MGLVSWSGMWLRGHSQRLRGRDFATTTALVFIYMNHKQAHWFPRVRFEPWLALLHACLEFSSIIGTLFRYMCLGVRLKHWLTLHSGLNFSLNLGTLFTHTCLEFGSNLGSHSAPSAGTPTYFPCMHRFLFDPLNIKRFTHACCKHTCCRSWCSRGSEAQISQAGVAKRCAHARHRLYAFRDHNQIPMAWNLQTAPQVQADLVCHLLLGLLVCLWLPLMMSHWKSQP